MCCYAYHLEFFDNNNKYVCTKIGSTINVFTRFDNVLKTLQKKHPEIHCYHIKTVFTFKNDRDARMCEDLMRAWMCGIKENNAQIGTDTFTAIFNFNDFWHSSLFDFLNEHSSRFNVLQNGNDYESSYNDLMCDRNNNLMFLWSRETEMAVDCDVRNLGYVITDTFDNGGWEEFELE